MLKRSGFFQNILCPFYATGLCERPHCHYKHSKPECSDTVSQLKDAVKTKYTTPLSCNESTTIDTTTPTAKLPERNYVSTRKQRISTRRANDVSDASNEYQPTPIALLKNRKNGHDIANSMHAKSSSSSDDANNRDFTTNDFDQTVAVYELTDKNLPGFAAHELAFSAVGVEVEVGSAVPATSGSANAVKADALDTSALFGDDSDEEQWTLVAGKKTQRKLPKETAIQDSVQSNARKQDMNSMNSDGKDHVSSSVDSSALSEAKDSALRSDCNRRIAHAAAAELTTKRPITRTVKQSPQDVMQQRWIALQREKATILHETASDGPSIPTKTAKMDCPEPSTSASLKEAGTRGGKRIAHQPTVEFLERPLVHIEPGSRVPTQIRQRYLNLIIDECIRFCPSTRDAFEKAVNEEMQVFRKSASKPGYINAAVCAIKRLRDSAGLGAPTYTSEASDSGSPARMTHAAAALGLTHDKNITVNRTGRRASTAVLQGKEFYDALRFFTLTSEQLDQFGFARPVEGQLGAAEFRNPEIAKTVVDDAGQLRCCCRCGKQFRVDPCIGYLINEECVYHWGRSFKRKIAGVFEGRYNCCQSGFGSEGCAVAKHHVTDVVFRENLLQGFVQTSPKGPQAERVFALDCEMVYTTQGCELARVSLVDERSNAVYDEIVKPEHTLIDPNTRFSGLREDDIMRSTVTLAKVQEAMLQLIGEETILVGHSLEGDLLCLKLLHERIVDTSVVFPHKLGLPYKRALRNLAAEHLQKIIQEDVNGHDSCEDAASCMQLMLNKTRDTLKAKSFSEAKKMDS